MATVNIVKIKVRRGTDSERHQIILDQGELGYTTDPSSQRLFVGDGVTVGGIPCSNKLYMGPMNNLSNFATAQVGDVIFDTNTSRLFALTGVNGSGFPNYSNNAAYSFIGPAVDNTTVIYNGNGTISVGTVSASNVSSSLFNLTNGGLARTGQGSVSVNVDANTLKVNGSNQIYMDFNYLQQLIAALPTSNPGVNKLWNNGGVVTIGH